MRKASRLAVDTKTEGSDVAEELADVFIMLCSVANRFEVEAAFRAKEAVNHQRTWR